MLYEDERDLQRVEDDPQPAEVLTLAGDAPARPRGWQFWRRRDQASNRLTDLNLSIEFYPASATNYVLRGELFEAREQFHLAAADYETALQLAAEQVTTDPWGLVAQTVQDRAMIGLRRVQHSE